MNKEFKRRQLRSMNEALKQTGRALAKITPDRKRCLDAVARCQHLIAWLKETISGDFRNKLPVTVTCNYLMLMITKKCVSFLCHRFTCVSRYQVIQWFFFSLSLSLLVDCVMVVAC